MTSYRKSTCSAIRRTDRCRPQRADSHGGICRRWRRQLLRPVRPPRRGLPGLRRRDRRAYTQAWFEHILLDAEGPRCIVTAPRRTEAVQAVRTAAVRPQTTRPSAGTRLDTRKPNGRGPRGYRDHSIGCDYTLFGGGAGNRTRVLRRFDGSSPGAVCFAATRPHRSCTQVDVTGPVAVSCPVLPRDRPGR